MDVQWRAMAAIIRHGTSMVFLVGDDGGVLYASRHSRDLTSGGRVRGQLFADLFADPAAVDLFLDSVRANDPGYSASWRTRLARSDGWTPEVALEASVPPRIHLPGLVVAVHTMEHFALSDPLTGLPNRMAFERALGDRKGVGCLSVLDVDHLKTINDEHGHSAGDKVLVLCAHRLQHGVEGVGQAFRIGGEEFAILLDTTDVATAEGIVGAALRTFVEPIELEPGLIVGVSMSAGLTELGGRRPGIVMREAGAAQLYAKKHARGGCVVVGRDMPDWARDHASILDRVESAVAEQERLAALARTDSLTELPNRLALVEDALRHHAWSRRSGHPYSVLFVDIDHFHRYNHLHGDQAGDKALIEVGDVLRSQCRAEDAVYRKGGEEFVVLLPETQLAEAMVIAERLRQAIVDRHIPYQGREDGLAMLTVVVGVAEYSEQDHQPEDTWERAAAPLMNTKRDENAPRNCVVFGVSGAGDAPDRS